MGFHVGQHVVCVDDRRSHFTGKPLALVRGTVYTIRRYYSKPVNDWGVLLHEIVSTADPFPDGTERGFRADRFRPLDESRLTVFRQMLVTPPSKELVDEDLDARIADCERAVREALGF